MIYRFPQLVRVVWSDARSGRRKSYAAYRLARHDEEAFEIAGAIEFCMVPQNARKLAYQVSALDHRPTSREAASMETTWVTFWREGRGMIETLKIERAGA